MTSNESCWLHRFTEDTLLVQTSTLPPINRRRFLASAVGGLAAIRCKSSALAIPPIARTGPPQFKLSLAAYSYRDLLTGNQPVLSLFDFVDDCAEMGLEGVELTSYYFPVEPSVDYFLQLKKRCFDLGLDISGTAVGNNFGVTNPEKRRQQIQLVKTWVDHAAVLGAPVIRIFAGSADKGMTADQAHALIVAGIEECCDYAGKKGVYLALENHGGPTATADGLLSFVRDVDSPWFAINLDTGNFHSEDVYRDLESIAPYAINVQIKVVTSGPDGRKHPTDFARLAKILRSVGYRGYIVLEYEEAGDPRQECPRYVNLLREHF